MMRQDAFVMSTYKEFGLFKKCINMHQVFIRRGLNLLIKNRSKMVCWFIFSFR